MSTSSLILDSLGGKSIRVVQAFSASLSFLASAVMASMIILPPNGGLSKPYRRIIFGISVSDMLQSMALIMGPWMLPLSSNEYDDTWGRGNESTCRINGFMLTIGEQAMPMYICLLCIHYLCNLKYRMTNDQFYYKIERKAHAFIVIFVVTIATGVLLSNSFHPWPQATFCFIGNMPRGCEFVPDLVGQCEERIQFYSTLFGYVDMFIPIICLIVTSICMLLMVAHVLSMTNTNTNTNSIQEESKEVSQEDECAADSIKLSDFTLPTKTTGVGDRLSGPSADSNNKHEFNVSGDRVQLRASSSASSRDQVGILSQSYRNEAILQGALYIGVFCYSYCSAMIVLVFNTKAIVTPLYLQIIALVSYPIGGVLNMLVYMRPKISYLRWLYPECSWRKGLCLVLRAGGEVPHNLDYDICCYRLVHRQEDIQEPVSQLSREQFSRPDIETRRPVVISSAPGVNGLSESFGDSYGEYIPKKDWQYLKGTEASIDILSVNNCRESMKDRIISILPSANDPVLMETVSDLTIDKRVG